MEQLIKENELLRYRNQEYSYIIQEREQEHERNTQFYLYQI
jgi:hypothetical protein